MGGPARRYVDRSIKGGFDSRRIEARSSTQSSSLRIKPRLSHRAVLGLMGSCREHLQIQGVGRVGVLNARSPRHATGRLQSEQCWPGPDRRSDGRDVFGALTSEDDGALSGQNGHQGDDRSDYSDVLAKTRGSSR